VLECTFEQETETEEIKRDCREGKTGEKDQQ